MDGIRNVISGSRDKEPAFEKLKTSHSIQFIMQRNDNIKLIRAELVRATTTEQKRVLWTEIASETFIQYFGNLYISEIYRVAYIVTFHLLARA